MPADILDLIDHAIEGATSPDAMRWTPNVEKVASMGVAQRTPLGFTPMSFGFIPAPQPTFPPIEHCVDPATGRVWIAPLGTPPPTGAPEESSAWVPVDAIGHVAERFGEILAAVGAAWVRAVQALGEQLGRAIARMEADRVLPEQPPPDPMARALWLRQHRNTGPAVQQRTPRRIDPRRTR